MKKYFKQIILAIFLLTVLFLLAKISFGDISKIVVENEKTVDTVDTKETEASVEKQNDTHWSERDEILVFSGRVIKIENDHLEIMLGDEFKGNNNKRRVFFTQETEIHKSDTVEQDGIVKRISEEGSFEDIIMGQEIIVDSDKNILEFSDVKAIYIEILLNSEKEDEEILDEVVVQEEDFECGSAP